MTNIKSFFKNLFSSDENIKHSETPYHGRSGRDESSTDRKIKELYLSIITKSVASFGDENLPLKGQYYLHILIYEYIELFCKNVSELDDLLRGNNYILNFREVLKSYLIEKYSSNTWFPDYSTESIFFIIDGTIETFFKQQLSNIDEHNKKGVKLLPSLIYSKLYDVAIEYDKDELSKNRLINSLGHFTINYYKLLMFLNMETINYCNVIVSMNILKKDHYQILFDDLKRLDKDGNYKY